MAIRSGDRAELYLNSGSLAKIHLGTGFIDESDTHTAARTSEYLLTGRDTLSQLVDNDAVDEKDNLIFVQSISVVGAAQIFLRNTRLASTKIIDRGSPGGNILLQTNVGETKANALQRYLEYCNCLVWSLPTGEVAIGKPNMAQDPAGSLILRSSDPSQNNVLDMRTRRNTNQAFRKIAVQLQSLGITNPAAITLQNQDPDVLAVAAAGVGRSVYRVFTLGNGMDTVNLLTQVGTSVVGGSSIGQSYAKRQLAMENMKVLGVEALVEGHVNENGIPYNTDQVYNVVDEEEDVYEPMYVYDCAYEMTPERGMTTSMKLCRLGSIVADVSQKAAR